MDEFAQVNGIQLHYLDHPGGEPPIVLLPGLTASAHAFNGLVEAGLSPRFRVLAPDLRGRGLSGKPDTGYTMADHAADVIALLDSLGLAQVVLGGHSFGGWVALYAAANYPERVSKLIIIDVAGTVHPRTAELIQPSVDRLSKQFPSLEDYLAQMRRMPFLHGWWDASIEAFYRAEMRLNPDGTVQAHTRAEAVIQSAQHAVTEPWDDIVAAIQQPAILFNAPAPFGPPEAPAVLPEANARATVEAMANCQYNKVPGNHITMIFGDGARHIVAEATRFLAA